MRRAVGATTSAVPITWAGWQPNDYPLAAVEEVITGAKDAESGYAQYLSDAVKE
jgi:hypothetical protein